MANTTLEARLEGHFSNDYRKIRIDNSRLGSISIILFPRNGSVYRIVTKYRFGELTFESVRSLIESEF